ncbi:MAG: 4-hydroxybenzoate octaprenyltransferase [Methylophilaceae bacterium]
MNMQLLIKKLDTYERLMRLDKPVGILLLMWPTLWGLLIAGQGHPHWPIVLIFVTGVVLMRSAGCVMNDIADRNYDGGVERTKNRPLISGEVTVKEAALLAASLSVAAFILVCFLNKMTILLSVAALFLAVTYPLTKRFLAIPQAYLGIAFGCSILMAFSAVNNHIPAVAWWLLLANVFWAIAYDTEYAMVDRDDDLKIGVKSSAICFGKYDVLAIMVCYVAMLGVFAGVGQLLDFGHYYYLGLAAVLALIVWQYRMIKQRTPVNCFKAFRMNHWIGCALFFGLAAEYYLQT